jgi:membrane fusion protein (multidrug efflux system)
VESAPGRKFQGRIANVSPSIEQTTRAFSVEILVDNRDRQLKPGFFAKGVIFTHRDENVMAISEDAISTLAGVSNVYVIENGKARQQMISLGTRAENLLEILGGLKGDEILAASNLSMLATGVPVAIDGQKSIPQNRFAEESKGKRGGRP